MEKENSMKKEKYVAYVSSYTMKDNHGIKIYDVDMENGRFSNGKRSRLQIPLTLHILII